VPARSLPDPEMHAAVHLVWREFSLFPALFHEYAGMRGRDRCNRPRGVVRTDDQPASLANSSSGNPASTDSRSLS